MCVKGLHSVGPCGILLLKRGGDVQLLSYTLPNHTPLTGYG
nr:MAG TPA: hypothetical protein [Caudoviricetes sp.]